MMMTRDQEAAIRAHLGRLLDSDLRYSMGRMSAAPSDCAEGIRALWPLADQRWRHVMLTDLRAEVERWERMGRPVPGLLGHQCDVDVWLPLLAWMEERP